MMHIVYSRAGGGPSTALKVLAAAGLLGVITAAIVVPLVLTLGKITTMTVLPSSISHWTSPNYHSRVLFVSISQTKR